MLKADEVDIVPHDANSNIPAPHAIHDELLARRTKACADIPSLQFSALRVPPVDDAGDGNVVIADVEQSE